MRAKLLSGWSIDDLSRGIRPTGVLPDLAQATGWSRADPAKRPHDAERALFGGWRIEDMEEKLGIGWGAERWGWR